MKCEIDKDFYCSADSFTDSEDEFERCILFGGRELTECTKENCRHYHRKYPTPEQYKEEYSEDVPDKMPVLIKAFTGKEWTGWSQTIYKYAKMNLEYLVKDHKIIIICCCTPFPEPDDTWRPE